jgi:hypothetical protein
MLEMIKPLIGKSWGGLFKSTIEYLGNKARRLFQVVKLTIPRRIILFALFLSLLSLAGLPVEANDTASIDDPSPAQLPPGQIGPEAVEVISLSGQPIAQSALAVADFNGDGKKEIVAGGIDGRVYLVDGATHTVIWDRQIADYFVSAITPAYCNTTFNLGPVAVTRIESGITIGDLDRNGTLEVVVATAALGPSKVGAIVVLTYVGGSDPLSLMPGWPRFSCDELGNPANFSLPDGFPDGFISTPAVGDLDGDGDLEIAIGGLDRRLHAWHHNGVTVAGWPIDRTRNYWRDSYSSPALADIDRDGLLEVIIGSNDYPIPGCPNPYNLYAINGDGTFVPGFPVYSLQNTSSSPTIGDINGDGWLDIVVGTGIFNETCTAYGSVFMPEGNKIHAWSHNGQPLPGWPVTTEGNMPGSPALGDIDGDGTLEVIAGCSDYFTTASCSRLYAWHGDGSLVAGFPVSPTGTPLHFSHSPILADYDGDGTVEIMVTAKDRNTIYIVEPNGTVNSDTSRSVAAGLVNTPVVDDIDGDNLLETVIGAANSAGKGAIYIWNETGTIYSRRPWPMFQHDVARTGLYTTPPPSPQLGFPGELRLLHKQGSGSTLTTQLQIRNLGAGQFNWQITNLNVPNLQINPTSGSVSSVATVQLILDTTGYTPNTWHHLGDLLIAGTAFGQPVASSPGTVSIWLYIGDISQLYFPAVAK